MRLRLGLSLLLACATPAWALPPSGELALTGALAVPAVWLGTISQHPPQRWTHAPGIDTWFRDRLKADSLSAQSAWATTSDFLVGGLILAPMLPHLPAIGRGEARVDTLLVSSQALLITGTLTAGAKWIAGRARPNPSRGFDSYFSGHTSFAFTGAALLASDSSPIAAGERTPYVVAAFATATTVGLLRIVADYHHFTDVLTGAAVGFTVGYIYPKLRDVDASRQVGMTPQSGGLSAAYTYFF